MTRPSVPSLLLCLIVLPAVGGEVSEAELACAMSVGLDLRRPFGDSPEARARHLAWRADLVLVGHAVDETFDLDGPYHTAVGFRVQSVLKGRPAYDQIVVKLLSGPVRGPEGAASRVFVSSEARFDIGHRYVLFLHEQGSPGPTDDGAWWLAAGEYVPSASAEWRDGTVHLGPSYPDPFPADWLEEQVRIVLSARRDDCRGDVAAITDALAHGADPDAAVRDATGRTALMVAAGEGRLDTVRELLARGSDVEATQIAGLTAMHYAAFSGHPAVITALKAAGAQPDSRDARGRTPLHWAVQLGRFDAARALVDAGADVEARSAVGWTPLLFAAQNDREPIVTLLLARGADPSRQSHQGSPPIAAAAGRGHRAIVARLLTAGADADEQAPDGWTALLAATSGEHHDLVRLLLARGADPDHRDAGFNKSAREWAEQINDLRLLRLFESVGTPAVE